MVHVNSRDVEELLPSQLSKDAKTQGIAIQRTEMIFKTYYYRWTQVISIFTMLQYLLLAAESRHVSTPTLLPVLKAFLLFLCSSEGETFNTSISISMALFNTPVTSCVSLSTCYCKKLKRFTHFDTTGMYGMSLCILRCFLNRYRNYRLGNSFDTFSLPSYYVSPKPQI